MCVMEKLLQCPNGDEEPFGKGAALFGKGELEESTAHSDLIFCIQLEYDGVVGLKFL